MSHGVIRGAKHGRFRTPKHGGASLMGITTDLHVLIMGQSNAVGQGDTNIADTGLDLVTPFPPCTANAHVGASNSNPIVYSDLATTILQPYGAGGSPNFGVELAIGRYLVRTHGAVAPFFSKIAVNGQDIETMLQGAGTPSNPKEMWLQIVDYIDARVAECGRRPDYVIWSQWEADATSDAKANAYSGNLDTHFANLRARYGNFRIVMHKASASATGAGVLASSRNIIRTTQVNWCAVGGNNAVLVDTDVYPLVGNIHYDQDGLVLLGNADAEIIASELVPGRNTNAGTGPAPYIQGDEAPLVTSVTTGPVTPWLPNHKSGDILVVAVVSSVTNTAPTLTVANGFAQLGSTVVNGTNMVLSVYTKTAASSNESAPTITPDATTERTLAIAFGIRGSSGTDGTATTTASVTPVSLNGPTTTQNNDLVVYVCAANSGNQAQAVTGWTDSTLAGFATARSSRRVVSSNALLISLGVGTKAAFGAVGPSSISYATAPFSCCMAIAFKP